MSALILIHFVHRSVQLAFETDFATHRHNSLGVLWKATSAIPKSGIQKLVADSLVGAHAFAHRIDVGAIPLAEVGNLVDEGDLAGQHCVAGILDHLSASDIQDENRVSLPHEGVIQSPHDFPSLGIIHAAHNAIGFHEIHNRITFLQELWIVCDLKWNFRLRTNCIAHFMTRSNWHGALDHDGLHRRLRIQSFQFNSDVIRNLEHIFQICTSIISAWRSNADENDCRIAICHVSICCERKSSRMRIALNHFGQTRFIDWTFAFSQSRNLCFIDIQASHMISHVCKASTCDKSDISSSNHRDVHRFFLLML